MTRRGFMFADALMALLLVAVAAGVLMAASLRVKGAVNILDDTRAAQRLATEVITAMQIGTQPPRPASAIIDINPSDDVAAPQGWRWVNVHCRIGRGNAELTGLVRSAS